MKNTLLFVCCFFVCIASFASTPLPPAPPAPCKVNACPLPANFNWIVACCDNAGADKEQFKFYMQDMIRGQQAINYNAWHLLKNNAISPETYQKIQGYLAWNNKVTTTLQVKDWPMGEIKKQAEENLNLVQSDVKKNEWIAPIKSMGWFYCIIWLGSLLVSLYFIYSHGTELYRYLKNKMHKKISSIGDN